VGIVILFKLVEDWSNSFRNSNYSIF